MRRPLILAAVLAGLAAAPLGAQAAVGWLQAPQLAADGAVRGAGVRFDGVAQAVFGAGTSELSVQRPFGRAWQAPVASGLPPGLTTVVQNAFGDRIGWARTPGGALVVSSRGTSSRQDDGSWSAPLTLATGVRAAAVALNDYREGVAAWIGTDGAVYAALRGRFGAWGAPKRLEPAGATTGAPVLALGESGDALVAWVRGAAGAGRIRVATRQASLVKADRPFRAASTVPSSGAQPRIAGAALSLTGDGTVAWIDGDPGVPGVLKVSDHRSGGSAWTRPAAVAPAAREARIGVAAAGGAVVAWEGTGGVQVSQRAAAAGRWTRVPGPPAAAARLADLVVTRLGDVAIAATDAGGNLLVVRRPSGGRAWAPAPLALDPGAVSTAILRSNGAGDLVTAWASGAGPVRAASFQAPDLPRLTKLAAHPTALRPGATTRLTFRLSAPGRVIVSLRRPFGARALAAFAVSGRAGANSVTVPRAAIARLLGPGRYVVIADTSARRLGLQTAIVRRTP